MGEMMECQCQEISSLIFLCWQRGWVKESFPTWPQIRREELHRLPAVLGGRKGSWHTGQTQIFVWSLCWNTDLFSNQNDDVSFFSSSSRTHKTCLMQAKGFVLGWSHF